MRWDNFLSHPSTVTVRAEQNPTATPTPANGAFFAERSEANGWVVGVGGKSVLCVALRP